MLKKLALIPFLALAASLTGSAPLLERESHHYVGELQESWQFPSDHLPVGATIDDFHVATWNVLNRAYIDWIEKDSQGLSKSLIITEHQETLPLSGLTLREEHVIKNIINMLNHPTHPRSILTLQECGQKFLAELRTRLPKHMKILYSSPVPLKDENVLIYNSRLFAPLSESKIVFKAFPISSPKKLLMDVVFTHLKSGIKYRIINVHVPGDPALPGKEELAKYIAENSKEDSVILIMGDMNFVPEEMQIALENAKAPSFKNLVNYYTNIGLEKDAKAIDHILVHMGTLRSKIETNQPNDVLQGLEHTAILLNQTPTSSPR